MTKPTNWHVRPVKTWVSLGIRPSLIRAFTVRTKKAWVLSYPLSAKWRLRSAWASQRRLWSDWADAQADLSLRWAHMPFCWFCQDAAQPKNQYGSEEKGHSWVDCQQVVPFYDVFSFSLSLEWPFDTPIYRVWRHFMSPILHGISGLTIFVSETVYIDSRKVAGHKLLFIWCEGKMKSVIRGNLFLKIRSRLIGLIWHSHVSLTCNFVSLTQRL